MDEFVDAKIEFIRRLDSHYDGPVAVLKTRGGDEYHVWLVDGHPMIQRVSR